MFGNHRIGLALWPTAVIVRTRLSVGALVLLALTFSLTSSIVQAQSTEFTYQGRLLSGDAPANGSHDFEFSLWDSVTAGNQIGQTITLTEVNVNNGVFSVRIDFGNQFPGANRFLQISVRQSGGTTFSTLAPRQAISSAPYAIRSLAAENAASASDATRLGGIEPSQYVITTDARLFDARDPLPNSQNYIQNTTIQQPVSNFNISGSGVIRGALTVGGAMNGNGSSLTNLNAGNIASGTLDSARLGIVPVSKGGTGLATPGFSGNLLRSNGSFWVSSPLISTDLPAGSSSYIQNTGAQQPASNFNISGNGTVGGTLSANIVNAANQLNIGGNRVLLGAGESNLFIGSQATGLVGVNNAIALGFRALVQQSNSLVLGSINGVNGATADTSVGIGTTTPLQRFHIAVNGGNFLVGGAGCPSGFVALGFGTTLSGCNNYSFTGNGTDTIINRPTGGIIALKRNNINQMTLSDNEVNISGSLNITGSLNLSNLISIGNLDGSGGTPLCRNSINNVSSCSSSIRYKTNINPFNYGLSIVRRLRPVSFNWKADNTLDFGLVAEEVFEAEPLLITRNGKGEIEGVKYDRVGVVLVNAVNEQEQRIEEQQKQIETQQRQIDEQKQIIRAQKDDLESQKRELASLLKLVCSQHAKTEICRPKN